MTKTNELFTLRGPFNKEGCFGVFELIDYAGNVLLAIWNLNDESGSDVWEVFNIFETLERFSGVAGKELLKFPNVYDNPAFLYPEKDEEWLEVELLDKMVEVWLEVVRGKTWREARFGNPMWEAHYGCFRRHSEGSTS